MSSTNLNFPVLGDNFGGVDRFWFVRPEDVLMTDPSGMVILKPGKFWSIGRATKFSLKYTCPSRESNGGTQFKPVLSGTVSKWTPELEAVLVKMRGKRFVIIVKDKNGYLTQVGNANQSLIFETSRGSGDTPASSNAIDFSFKGTLNENAAPNFYNLEIITDQENGNSPIPQVPKSIVKINGQVVAMLSPGEIYSISSDFTLEFELQNVVG